MTRIYLTALAFLCIIIATVLGVSLANAGPPCGDRQAMVHELRQKFGETTRAIGVENRGGLIEIFASDTGTWTILVSSGDGLACVIGTGVAFEIQPLPKAGIAG